ncbi:MAG: LysM peptidoglycan-binding domain-containing protein [Candidatus Protochlamydia sp.]|nr:LysM peptidoglycan-binding domain-containing protein [Candidatus Protochlamydia sp.]
MSPEQSTFLVKIRRLSQALLLSGILNMGVLGLLAFWIMRERPPTSYCELKPIEDKERQSHLVDSRDGTKMIGELHALSFIELVKRLEHDQLIENGYAERDLALACLIAFHDFDLTRALAPYGEPKQKRYFTWQPPEVEKPLLLSVFPTLSTKQYDAIIQFAKTERWPMTSYGLFNLIKKQANEGSNDAALNETFFLTPEFWAVELLFRRLEKPLNKQEILQIVVESGWENLKHFVEQQRHQHDLSDGRRQKFLLDSIKAGSKSAALLLLHTDPDFVIKKLDDAFVIQILQLLSDKTEESESFAKEMLSSPRSAGVWKAAAVRLLDYAGESMPKGWNYQMALSRFIPEKVPVAKPELGRGILTAAADVPKPVPIAAKAIPVKAAVKTVKVKEEQLYTVQEGDTLWKISRLFKADVEEIKKMNKLKSAAIKPGMMLKIPKK